MQMFISPEALFAIGMPGLPEMMIILFVVLLLFGGAKLPSLMRNLGRSANEFNAAWMTPWTSKKTIRCNVTRVPAFKGPRVTQHQ